MRKEMHKEGALIRGKVSVERIDTMALETNYLAPGR